MGSLLAGALDGVGQVVGLVGDATPYVPSAPVQIGTSGPRHGVAEAGSWQGLIVMFGLVLVIGAAVLMFAVRQRTRVLERRRVRRMAVAVALMGDADGAVAVTPATATLAASLSAAAATSATSARSATANRTAGVPTRSAAIPVKAPSAKAQNARTPAPPPRTTPATPGRPAPNA